MGRKLTSSIGLAMVVCWTVLMAGCAGGGGPTGASGSNVQGALTGALAGQGRAPQASTGRIAFACDRDPRGQGIYVMDDDGTHVRCLVHGMVFCAAWSPDGTRVAFGFPAGDAPQIFVVNADGTGMTQLTHAARLGAESPAWSPDGSKIAFTAWPRAAFDWSAIYVMNADGTNVTRLTHGTAFDENPAWSPDGARIAFESGGRAAHSNWQIYLTKPDGTGMKRLTRNDRADQCPAWSPDGTRIAFNRWEEATGEDVCVMNADGTGVTQLASSRDFDMNPTWSPEGSRIAYSRAALVGGSLGRPDIYVMNADGSGKTRLIRNGFRPSWWGPR